VASLETGSNASGWHPPETVDLVDSSLAGRIRVLTLATLGPLITGYAAVAAVLALVTAVASRAHFSTVGVLKAAAPGWLAVHQVPIQIEGAEFGALPLLPTIAAVVLVARTAAGAAQRLGSVTPAEGSWVVMVIVAGHGGFGVLLGVAIAGGPASVDALAAFYYPALLAAVAATIGIARHCGLIGLALERIDDVALRGLRAGAFAVVALLAAGALTLVLGLLTSVPAIRELFARNGSGPGSALGMLLLSAAYLPNAVIAATSFVAGSGFSMGSVSIGPLSFTGGWAPELPLLAALPEQPAGWWPLLFLLPVGAGALVGRLAREVSAVRMDRLRTVAIAAGVVGLIFVILAGAAGGRLGSGQFDPVSMRAALLSVVLVVWVGLSGAAVAWLGRSHPRPDPAAGEPGR
jgi:hypothetical protein